jgi:hypothetical protein
MKAFNLTPSNASLRAAACEFSSLKRSAKVSLRKASLNFKTARLAPRRSHDGLTSDSKSPAPPAPVRASTDTYRGEVICISRESTFDSSSVVDISPDELESPSGSPYASSCSSSSSSSCELPPEIDDRSLGEYDPRRGSQLSVVSSWVDDHLQELDISYREGGVYGIGIVTPDDGFHSRRDSFILPPYETFQSYHGKRNLPVVPPKYSSPLSRPLPLAPPPSPGSGPQSRHIRPLPPPPSR